jgi:hypothetical protein
MLSMVVRQPLSKGGLVRAAIRRLRPSSLVGDEAYVSIHLVGADAYASAKKGQSRLRGGCR